MKGLIFVFLFILVSSCQKNEPRTEFIEKDNLTQSQIDSILNGFKFQYETPILLDSSSQVLIPISTKVNKKRKGYNKLKGYSDNYNGFWNIFFYNWETEKESLLSENKIRISKIHVNDRNRNSPGKYIKNKNIYEISDTDFNNDQRLNFEDPNFLFISNQDGEELKRISPLNEDLKYFTVLPNDHVILMKTLRDSNKDSLFNHFDEPVWYKTELDNHNNWNSKEIIDSIQRKRIENIYFEQWLKKK